jgi:hypothetical protein
MNTFSEMFIAHLSARTIRVESDLVDQLFNSSENLARALLLLANFGKEGRPEPIIANISQATLAEMIGSTRPGVTHFINKFRKLGFIEYNGALKVHSSLLSVVLHDRRRSKVRRYERAIAWRDQCSGPSLPRRPRAPRRLSFCLCDRGGEHPEPGPQSVL